jgi:Golgi nucleoside diphosphatase
MNTPFCELKGSYHGSPRHHNANYHKNCVEFKTGDENINLYQYTNGTTHPNYKEVSSTTLKSDYDDYNSENYDQDQIDALRIEQMERNYNSYNMISNV